MDKEISQSPKNSLDRSVTYRECRLAEYDKEILRFQSSIEMMEKSKQFVLRMSPSRMIEEMELEDQKELMLQKSNVHKEQCERIRARKLDQVINQGKGLLPAGSSRETTYIILGLAIGIGISEFFMSSNFRYSFLGIIVMVVAGFIGTLVGTMLFDQLYVVDGWGDESVFKR